MLAVNRAIAIGKKLQSRQTGFLHYCSQSEDHITHDTIPVYENALFALALFRTKIVENVLEGKEIINKILAFEIPAGFPTYLHEYPSVVDPYLELRLLPIFFWILQDFSTVIGSLSGQLEECLTRIVGRVEKVDLPKWGEFRLKAYKGKIGPTPTTHFEWGEVLVSLQMAQKLGADIAFLMQEAAQFWHSQLGLYIGPTKRVHQYRSDVEVVLFDLFMAHFAGHLPKRMEQAAPIDLRGALLRPYSLEFGERPAFYRVFHSENECPLFIAWEDHTFVLAKQNCQIEEVGSELLIRCDEEMGINFYLNYLPGQSIFVNGGKATTFRSGDQVHVKTEHRTLSFQFNAEDGVYCGHIFRGNRPSQHGCVGPDQFTAFDWRFAIRTIRPGKIPILVRVSILQQELENRQPLPLHEDHCQHTESFL